MQDAMSNEFAAPAVVDRRTFQAELDALRAREKAHTREGDAIAAARRRLPHCQKPSRAAVARSRRLGMWSNRKVRFTVVMLALAGANLWLWLADRYSATPAKIMAPCSP